MNTSLVWKAEVEFQGTVEEFAAVAAALTQLPIAVRIAEFPAWPRRPYPGIPPLPILDLIGPENLDRLLANVPRAKIRLPKDVAGGIRTPHFHVGDEIVLLDRERFKTAPGLIAKELAERRVAVIDDFPQAMKPIDDLAVTPITLP